MHSTGYRLWTCRRYEYPYYIVDWIKNDTTNWRKINDKNGGTYQYFARMNQRVIRNRNYSNLNKK